MIIDAVTIRCSYASKFDKPVNSVELHQSS